MKNLNELLALDCNQPLVTLYIFSSRANPTWPVNMTQMVTVKNLATKIYKDFDNHTFPNQKTTRIMGYQGFSISCSINNEIFIHGIAPIEEELLNTGRPYLSSTIVEHVNENIGQYMSVINYKSLSRVNCHHVPIKGSDSVPIFNPQTDNGGCFITEQSQNNCYAYGNLYS